MLLSVPRTQPHQAATQAAQDFREFLKAEAAWPTAVAKAKEAQAAQDQAYDVVVTTACTKVRVHPMSCVRCCFCVDGLAETQLFA